MNEMMSLEEVAEMTGLNAERILEIAGTPLFPAAIHEKWRRSDIEQFMEQLKRGLTRWNE